MSKRRETALTILCVTALFIGCVVFSSCEALQNLLTPMPEGTSAENMPSEEMPPEEMPPEEDASAVEGPANEDVDDGGEAEQ